MNLGSGAAHQLEGLTLPGGWQVVKKLERDENATGGYFSVQYIIQGSGGEFAFCKALDVSRALGETDPALALQMITEGFNFERDLLERSRGLSRVIQSIDDGVVDVPNAFPPKVNYIIFELAERDIRQALDIAGELSVAGKLRALHHAATGLWQLHQRQVAHQDLKPSNIFMLNGPIGKTENKLTKVGDLGRAHDRNVRAPHDDFEIAGDMQYAPPEQLFGYLSPSYQQRRVACDLYQFGSLVTFVFTGVTMNGLMGMLLQRRCIWSSWGDTYEEALPYVRDAFGQALRRIRDSLPFDIADEIVVLIAGLCEPDPALRGFPATQRGKAGQYDLHRAKVRLDLLARRVQKGIIRRYT